MPRHTAPALVSSLPFVLFGSLPLDAIAGEFFFPVLADNGSHWFSWFDPTYNERNSRLAELRPALQLIQADAHATTRYEQALEQGLLPQDAYGGSQMEVLAQLSKFYRNQGRYAEAFDRLERQYFLARVTYGLHDARHIPLLQELVELALLKGEPQRSHEVREALLGLQLRNFDHDDARRTEALLSWADWQLQCFKATLEEPGMLKDQSHDLRANAHFIESDAYFRRALKRLEQQTALTPEEHHALLLAMRKWQALHFMAFRQQRLLPALQQHGLPGHPTGTEQAFIPLPRFGDISSMLEPTREPDLGEQAISPELRALQLLQLGDWQHAIGLSGAAGHAYAEASALLHNGGLPANRIDQLLTPGLPVPDPEHWYHYQQRAPRFRGYLEVDIRLDARGHLLQAELLDPMASDTRLGKALLQHITASRFRPAATAGAGKQGIRLRYYHE